MNQLWPLRNYNYFVISVSSVFKLLEVLLADSAQPLQISGFQVSLQCCPFSVVLPEVSFLPCGVLGKVAQGGGTISLEMCFWLSLLRRGKQKF